jgi:hypothetical protein
MRRNEDEDERKRIERARIRSARGQRKSARREERRQLYMDQQEQLRNQPIPLFLKLMILVLILLGLYFPVALINFINSLEDEEAPYVNVGGSGRAAVLENYPIHLPRNNVMYQVFTRYGIEIPTTRNELQRAYRVASLRVHPDRPGGDTSLYQEFSDAYDTFLHEGRFFGAKERKHNDLLYYVDKIDIDILKHMVHRMLNVLPHKHKEKILKHASNISKTNQVVDVFNQLTDKQKDHVISLLDKVHKQGKKEKEKRISKRRA